jgi:hypothetical protein
MALCCVWRVIRHVSPPAFPLRSIPDGPSMSFSGSMGVTILTCLAREAMGFVKQRGEGPTLQSKGEGKDSGAELHSWLNATPREGAPYVSLVNEATIRIYSPHTSLTTAPRGRTRGE